MTITVKELIKELKQFNPEALVYVYADHGQLEEQSQGVSHYTDTTELTYYGEDMNWGTDEDGDGYDIKPKNATAICIG